MGDGVVTFVVDHNGPLLSPDLNHLCEKWLVLAIIFIFLKVLCMEIYSILKMDAGTCSSAHL